MDRARRTTARLARAAASGATGEPPYVLAYELETSSGYVTERLHVSVADGPELTLVRGQSPELDGIARLRPRVLAADERDAGAARPAARSGEAARDRRRLGLRPGSGRAPRPPDLRAARRRRVRFRSPDAGFERVIELTPEGFVLDYPDIARLMTRFMRERA